MNVLIDACVLYPTVLRELVLSLAKTGAFQPLWSERILEEWRRAALKNGEGDGAIAAGEIAMAKANFPEAMVVVNPATQARLHLPDPNDTHVLAAAIDGRAEALLTLNLKDFPTGVLSAHYVLRRAPDEFLLEAFHEDETALRSIVEQVLERAASHGIDAGNPRKLLKRARLPRLGKALYAS